ncbi:monovalent cation/H(+) antiporter subunit G [Wenzhouxiangella sp. XN79A]|uniref:monovalent cation/H(+) antiporter subunit G n=1 Tax=Wenzhouxiangella sp. XN79A TaxID=2724193 RepID=UPI00144AC5A0|nr:monovalent cation/H(+) antiporter subunit G [Wenzhouxiangella sp. XN79A]NKI35613.1 monovalent cation/H(+) antiporter subunit G [Wenzhouxiangella sp. XN79A]
MLDALTLTLIGLGLGFFAAGSVGLIRFPDSPSRLHALTKADNLGLGLIALGLAFQVPDLGSLLKLLLVWALAIFSAGAAAQLVGRVAVEPDDGLPDSTER